MSELRNERQTTPRLELRLRLIARVRNCAPVSVSCADDSEYAADVAPSMSAQSPSRDLGCHGSSGSPVTLIEKVAASPATTWASAGWR